MELGFIRTSWYDFAQVMRPALRSDGPQDVGQVLAPETLRSLDIVDTRLDLGAASLRFHGGFTFGFRHQHRASEIDFRGQGPILVIDCVHVALNHGYAIDRNCSAAL